MTVITARAQFRRGTAAEWTSVNPILASGELGLESDTGKFKIGDGTASWTDLVYSSGPPGIQGPQGVPGFAGPQAVPGSIGIPGQALFGAGPIVPAGATFYPISPDLYEPVHLLSGSVM
jgi:hypothetical protein